MTIPAKSDNGVFRPLDAVQMQEGMIADVVIPASQQPAGERPRSVRDFAFCGMWQGRDEMLDSVEYINRLRGDLRG